MAHILCCKRVDFLLLGFLVCIILLILLPALSCGARHGESDESDGAACADLTQKVQEKLCKRLKGMKRKLDVLDEMKDRFLESRSAQ